MGGLALKAYDVKRLEGDDYATACESALAAVNAVLDAHSIASPARLIPSYRQKTSHGDVDIIVSNELLGPLNAAKIASSVGKELGVQNAQFKVNDYVVSVAAPHPEGGFYQLDLLLFKPESLDFAHAYMSWNDVSTLLLRIAAPLQLSIGPNGLSYMVREEKAEPARIILTRDFKQALEFFKLDYERWTKGFDSMEEIYEFIAACPSVTQKNFELGMMQASVRKGFAKRPGYLGFLEWLNNNPVTHKKFNWRAYLNNQKSTLWAAFPGAKDEYDAFIATLERKRAVAAAFNGKMVIEVTGLEGKALGEFIIAYKASHASQAAFEEFVVSSDRSIVFDSIRDFLGGYKVNVE